MLGKNDAGDYQDQGPVPTTATVSKSWTVTGAPVRRVVINELIADNKTIFSNNATWPDVIELYNDGSDINLADMSLSGSTATPRKFIFPANTMLAAGQYLLVMADSVTTAPGMHTGFGLKKTGDAVYLYESLANGGGLVDSVQFGVQLTDRSIGRQADGTWNLCVPTLGAANLFQPLSDPANLKLNEWLAKGSGATKDDYVELYNPASLPAPLGGLYLTDNILSEPTKSLIPALSFIEGTRSAGSGLALFTADGDPTAGANHTNFKLASDAGSIGLFSSSTTVIDSIIYGVQTNNVAQGRTPNGASLIGFFSPTPGLDNPSPSSASVITTNLIPINKVWKYDQTEFLDGISWQAAAYDDTGAGWGSGAALLYVEDAALPAAKNTALPNYSAARITYYFRTHFTFSGDPTKAILKLKTVIDDGAIFYLNGVEIKRLGIADGAAAYATLANRSVGDAVFEGPFTVPSTALIAGDNVLAAEVHQSSNASSDIVFGLTLDSEVSTVSGAGAALVINEILTKPAAGQNQFIEIYNPTAGSADISGWYLTDDLSVPKKYLIPTTSPILTGGYATIDQALFGGTFLLNPLGGTIYLSSADASHNLTGYSNGFNYEASATGTSFGKYVTTTGDVQYPAQKSLTNGALNSGPQVGPVVISEIMYNPAAGGDSFLGIHEYYGISGLAFRCGESGGHLARERRRF